MKIGVFQKGRREAVKSRFDLGRSMVACLILMTVSCFMFVGTTLSWFSDTTTSAANEIKAGTFAVSMRAQDEQRSAAEEQNALSVAMTRLDKKSEFWEPGAIFVSKPMWVQNDGNLDLEYRLDLLTAKDTALEQEDGNDDLSLLDVIAFRIISAQDEQNSESNEDFLERIKGSFEDSKIDQRTSPETRSAETRDSVVNADLSVRLLPASMGRAAMSSDRFVVVGMMKENANNEYSDMTLDTPFTVVVTAQQTETTWEDIPPTVCTVKQHEAWAENAVPFADDQHGYWKDHSYYCIVCDEKLHTVDDVAEVHAALAEAAEKADATTTSSLWTRVDGTMVDYFCRDCNKRIATKNGNTLYFYETSTSLNLTPTE